jgi:hypothetical protein
LLFFKKGISSDSKIGYNRRGIPATVAGGCTDSALRPKQAMNSGTPADAARPTECPEAGPNDVGVIKNQAEVMKNAG